MVAKARVKAMLSVAVADGYLVQFYTNRNNPTCVPSPKVTKKRTGKCSHRYPRDDSKKLSDDTFPVRDRIKVEVCKLIIWKKCEENR